VSLELNVELLAKPMILKLRIRTLQGREYEWTFVAQKMFNGLYMNPELFAFL
jgi:hypothetical protein